MAHNSLADEVAELLTDRAYELSNSADRAAKYSYYDAEVSAYRRLSIELTDLAASIKRLNKPDGGKPWEN